MKFDSNFTFENHVHGIASRVSQKIDILRLVKRIFVVTSVFLRSYFSFVFPILEYCSQVWGPAAECHFQLLECQVYSVARLCPDQNFLTLCHRRLVAGLSILYKVNSNSKHSLFSQLQSASTRVRPTALRPQLIHLNLKYQGVERSNLLGLSCRLRFDCGITFLTLCLTPERWMSSRVQSTVGYFHELCFLQFSVAPVLVGLRKQFINNFVFSTWACAAGFNKYNNNNSIMLII